MDAKDMFLQSVGLASSIVAQVDSSDYEKPTPNLDWTVRDLLDHVITELAWTSDIVADKTIEQVGTKYNTDLIGERLQDSWGEQLQAAQQAVLAADPATTAHLSYGNVPLDHYLLQAAADQLIHSWDLATAIAVPVEFPEQLTQELIRYTEPRLDTMKQSGLFADPVTVSPDASDQTKLLALYGRAG